LSDAVLRVEQLVVRYPGSPGPTLDGLDLSLAPGASLALVGPSGCGKSTLARAVLQLLPPGSQCSGGLELAGRDPRQLGRRALRQLRASLHPRVKQELASSLSA
jgi:peptide/nickel transport system ATP-binding protein